MQETARNYSSDPAFLESIHSRVAVNYLEEEKVETKRCQQHVGDADELNTKLSEG